ncbi:alcohol dehydrogenase catalytic domain-containing protein [Paraburkholderia aspalathi]|nr:alcohol dehydrogenase catalytic domain-containing protein [Paraburkholderia aspalathi]
MNQHVEDSKKQKLSGATVIRAARLHAIGEQMRVDKISMPPIGPDDVYVDVKACNIVPNLNNILVNWKAWNPDLPLPNLPAVFGLDTTGVISQVGKNVSPERIGQRVYVNPGLSCGRCLACARQDPINCKNYTFMGYFGFGAECQPLYDRYPLGGLAEKIVAPAANLVPLPNNLSFEQGARFGYLGTSFSALKKGNVRPDSTLLLLGITGTLGLGAALNALAMGVSRIYGTGRNADLLSKVKSIAPDRIEVLSLDDGPIASRLWELTHGDGVEVAVNCLGPGAPASYVLDAFNAMARGGRVVNVSGVQEHVPLDAFDLMCRQVSLISSNWFTVREGLEMAELARTGLLDLSYFEQNSWALSDVNSAINSLPTRQGGFSNYTIVP